MLVLGASGGVGTGCVLLAKMLGAEVIACASSAEKLARLKEIGADEVIDYTKTDWSKWAVEKYGKPQRRTYDGGVDVVINFTGGDTWVPSLRCLKRGGKLLVCGATAGYDPKEDLRYVWSFELQIIGSNSFYDDNLAALMELIGAGKIKPVIDKVLPLEQAARRPAPDPGPRGHRQGGGDAMSDDITLEQVQALVTRAPFHQWLGLTVSRSATTASRSRRHGARNGWSIPSARYTHGGILAALIDLAADWAHGEANRARRADHRSARRLSPRRDAGRPDRRAARSSAGGSQFSTAEAQIFDADGKLLASGRGTYFTAPPKPA